MESRINHMVLSYTIFLLGWFTYLLWHFFYCCFFWVLTCCLLVTNFVFFWHGGQISCVKKSAYYWPILGSIFWNSEQHLLGDWNIIDMILFSAVYFSFLWDRLNKPDINQFTIWLNKQPIVLWSHELMRAWTFLDRLNLWWLNNRLIHDSSGGWNCHELMLQL